jgi:hypothetical protein
MVGDSAVRNISLIWKRNKAENLYIASPKRNVSATFEGKSNVLSITGFSVLYAFLIHAFIIPRLIVTNDSSLIWKCKIALRL